MFVFFNRKVIELNLVDESVFLTVIDFSKNEMKSSIVFIWMVHRIFNYIIIKYNT